MRPKPATSDVRKNAVMNWLPHHQQHLLYSLSHVDSVIENIGNIHNDYQADAFVLGNRVRDGREEVVLQDVSPLPEAIPRLAADAFNQLRSALEHALFSEVQHLMGRQLEVEEAKALELPVPKDEDALADWYKHRRRRTLPVLHANGVLGQRIKQLQPFQENSHPLRLLAEYTNLSKHRTPVEVATRLGRIVPDFNVTGLKIEREPESDLQIGEVLLSVPAGVRLPIDIWPMVGIRRPHTGSWNVLLQELRRVESWVRVEALPLIITGDTNNHPIPPHLDASRGYADYSEAFSLAKGTSAAERQQIRLMGQSLRQDLPSVFQQALGGIPEQSVTRFVSNLSDAAAINVFDRYWRVRQNRGETSANAYLRRILSDGA